ncbi:MAG TPA: type II toxin-antitoxin system VapC family toxin, partial [Candidatus Binatia bacterium]|nr:type II toxin-antitoxin system VapC family toxin [Candidatus Binatia bacterium]
MSRGVGTPAVRLLVSPDEGADPCPAGRPRAGPRPVRGLRRCRPGDVGISSISLAELWHGVAKSRNPEENGAALEGFLLPLEVFDFGEAAALAYGAVRASLEKDGTTIGAMDTLIAAHAVSLG